jgi:putative oxidoreductase
MSVFVLPLSRILLSLVFIFTGYIKVFGWGPADKPIQNMDMWKQRVAGLKIPGTGDSLPNPDLLAQIAAYGELVGGILLFLGILSRVTALGFFIFVIIASVLGHAFWTLTDPVQHFMQLNQFLKNMGIAGGLLLIIGAGGGALSVDGMFRRPQYA